MAKSQTLAVGKTAAPQQSRFGFKGKRMVAPFDRLFGLCVAFPGDGKTSLFLSSPDCLVINCDGTSTPINAPGLPNPPGIMVPGRSADGQIVMPGPGSNQFEDEQLGVVHPVVFGWSHVQAVQKQLIQAAQDKDPDRPSCVCLDSLTSAIRMIQKYLTAEAGKDDWKELHGQSAWDTLYTMLLDFAVDLRDAGYGVFWTAHLVSKVIQIGENENVFRTELQMTDNFYKRVYPNFDIVFAISKEDELETTNTTKEVTLKNGEKRSVPHKVTENVRNYYLQVDNTELKKMLKRRVKLDDRIKLPQEGSFQAVVEAYNKAAYL